MSGAGDDEPFVASMGKDFYVSPFIDIAGRYTVHVARSAAASCASPSPCARTTRRCWPRASSSSAGALRDRTIARMLVRHPLVTLKTIGADPLARLAAVAAGHPVPAPRGRDPRSRRATTAPCATCRRPAR